MKQFLRATLSRIDWLLVVSIGILCIVGSLTQYSLSIEPGVVLSSKMVRQLMYTILAIGVFAALSFINYRLLNISPWVYAGASVLALIAVLVFGRELKGATGWIIIGSLSIQPVEIVKLSMIAFFAGLMYRQEHEPRISYASIIQSGGANAVVLLLILLQPDLGSATIIAAVWFGLLAVAKAPRWVLIALVASALVAGIVGWFFVFEEYQKDRLSIFLNRESDPLGKGYNITQSIIAVGSGGLWGKGFGEGTQSQLQFLPEASSDFAFAVVAEEFGFLGAGVVIAALALIVARAIHVMRSTHDTFAFFFCGGVALYMTIQSLVVIGMNMGIMPVTGLPLPFISSGGSSLLITAAMLGMVHSMRIHR